MSRRPRGLSPDDRAVWAHVVQSVRPLPGRDMPLPEPVAHPGPARPVAETVTPTSRAARRDPPPLAPLERRTRQRLARGQQAIDGAIDLHGLRQAEAHRALLAFLHQAHHAGWQIVIVITGKGGGGPGPDGEVERGVLRRMVPHWLADPGLRRIVLGFEEAARGHGGQGALYVRIRRLRGEG